VRSKLADVPTADQPLAYDGLSDLKMSSVAQNGTAAAYLDSYSIDATSSSAEESVDRNASIGAYDTPTFHIFPAVEMGINKHANRFNFDITDPAQSPRTRTGSTASSRRRRPATRRSSTIRAWRAA
jgi:hypothetical protein